MKLPFDEVYLLNLCERPDKYKDMRQRIDYMGWDIKDFRVVKHPISEEIINSKSHIENLDIWFAGEFNCAREEYTIIKSAYLRGLNSVGIIEDDCSFYKDISLWEEYMNNLPDDWDILRINCLRGGYEEYYCNLSDSTYWVKQENAIYGTGFYILNRNGMKYMIDSIDKKFQAIDMPLFNIYDLKTSNINVYIPKLELSLCLEDSFNSDIRENCINKPCHNYYKDISKFKKENYI
jgi:hypothetical protein